VLVDVEFQMNANCFKTVFSERSGCLIAVGEHACSQGKSSGESVFGESFVVASASVFIGALVLSQVLVGLAWAQPAVNALPTASQVVQGAASVAQSASQMTINQSTQRAAINWQSFDIGASAKVNVVQPNAQAVLLNRVVGQNPSQIYGQISANGHVILVNPNGVLFGKDGSINAGSFTASTLGITDANFMAANMVYERNGSTAGVVNQGSIQVLPGGYVALLGASVSNEGKIVAPQGGVAMGAAETIKVPVSGSGRIKLELSAADINASVKNTGQIVSEGGQVYMQALALNRAAAQVIQSGSIDTSSEQGGAVHLLANGGMIKVDGSITANSTGTDDKGQQRKGGDIVIGRDLDTNVLAAAADVSGAELMSLGGFVETSGQFLATKGTRVLAKDWLLDPVNITIAASGISGTAYGDSDGATAGVQFNPGTSSTILASDVASNLNAGTNVIISTGLAGSPGTDAGNISVNAAIVKSGSNNASLTLDANNRVIVNARIGRASNDTTSTGNLDVTIVARGNAQTAAQGSAYIANVIDAVAGTVDITGTSLSGWEAVIFQGTSGINAGTYAVRGTNSSTAVRFNGGTATFNSSLGNSLIEGTGGGEGGIFASSGNTINLNTTGTATTTLASSASSTAGIRLGFGGGVTVNTNGNVTIGAHHTNARLFTQAQINVNSGHLRILGRSASNGIGLQDGSGIPASINVNNGSTLTMHGIATTSGNGIDLRPQGVANFITMSGTNAGQRGSLNLIGESSTGAGIYTNGATITSDGGDINLTGTSQGNAIVHDGLIRSGNASSGGVVTLNGTSTGSVTPRVAINSSGSVQGASVVLSGTSAGAQGVYTAGAVTAVAGTITMTGTSAQGTGVHTQGLVRASGNVTLDGTSTSTNTQGVIIQNSVESTAGDISITGVTSASTQRSISVTANGSVYGALAVADGRSISVAADTLLINTGSTLNVGATGTVNLQTTSANVAIALGAEDTMSGTRVLGLSQDEINRITAGQLNIGNPSNSGTVSLSSAITTNASTGHLALQTGGNITINNALTLGTARTLTLNAAGAGSTVTQSAAIQASGLRLLGSSVNYSLTNIGNTIGTIAANANSVALNNTSALSVGTLGNTSGITTNNGMVSLTSGGAISGSGPINSGLGAITLNTASGSGTYSGVITSSGSLTKSGTGTVTFSADHVRSGSTSVTGGTLVIGTNGTSGNLGSGNVSLSNGATLAISRSDSINLSNSISGTGNVLASSSAGTLTLSNMAVNGNVSASAAGDVSVTNSGTISLSAQSTANNGNIDITNTGGTMTTAVVNGITGVTTHGTGNITLSSTSSSGDGLYILSNVTALSGDVTLAGSTSTTSSTHAGVRARATVRGKNITMTASATSTSGHVLGYYGAGGHFIASETLALTGTSTSGSGNGLYSFAGSFHAGTGMSLTGTSTNGQGVGFDNASVITNGNSGNLLIAGTASTAGQQGIGLNGAVITNGSSGGGSTGAITLQAHAGLLASTTTFGGVNRITQNGSGNVTLRSNGNSHLTVPIIVNNGTGDVVVAAGSDIAAGTGIGGQVLTVSGNNISQNNGGTTYVYSGEASTTGQLSDLSAAFNELVYQGSGLSQNSRFNTAFGGNTIAGASTQVSFRETTAPSFTLALNNISKTYGDADPALTDRNTALLNAYIGPSTLTTAVNGANGGSNTFAVAAADVINNLTGTSRAAGSNVGSYAYTNVSASAFNTNLSAQPNLVINRRDITLSGVIAATKFYDGNTSAGITGGTFNNIVAGETLALSGTGYFNSPNVNGVSNVTVDNAATLTQAVGGTGAWSNYNLLPAAGAITSSASGKITPVALTARVNDSAVFVTQSASSAPDMGVMYTGFVNGESASTALSGLGVRTYSGAANYPVAGSYTNVFGLSATPLANHGNYTVTVALGALTVVPADKLLIRVDSQNSTYGQQTAAVDGVAGLGTVGAYYCLDASVACNGANLVHLNLSRLSPNRWKAADSTGSFVVFDTSISGASYSTGGYLNVGNYQYAVSEISPLSLPNGNFTGRFSNTGVLTVDAQPITATYLASDKRVDGTASAQVVSTTSGFLAGDQVSDQWVSASFDTASVGNGKTVSINGVQLQGADRANYRLINPFVLTTANILPVDVPQDPKPAKPQGKPVVHGYELDNNAAEKRVIRSDVVLPAGAAVASEEGSGSAGAVDSAAGGHLGGLASRSKPTDDMAACVSDVVTPMTQEASSSCVCKPTPVEGIQVCTELLPSRSSVSGAL
jgi:filamentous hemagglutinin family protein